MFIDIFQENGVENKFKIKNRLSMPALYKL